MSGTGGFACGCSIRLEGASLQASGTQNSARSTVGSREWGFPRLLQSRHIFPASFCSLLRKGRHAVDVRTPKARHLYYVPRIIIILIGCIFVCLNAHLVFGGLGGSWGSWGPWGSRRVFLLETRHDWSGRPRQGGDGDISLRTALSVRRAAAPTGIGVEKLSDPWQPKGGVAGLKNRRGHQLPPPPKSLVPTFLS